MQFTVNISGPLCLTSSDPAEKLELAIARVFPGAEVSVRIDLPEPSSADSLLRTLTVVLDVGPDSRDGDDPDEGEDAGDVDFEDMTAA